MSESFFQEFPQYPNEEHVDALFSKFEEAGLAKGIETGEGRGFIITNKGQAWMSLLVALDKCNEEQGGENYE
jgi:hypothetical protein|tara:strand:- start:250 stop:465 length:216 start_codon:yes stop_codon:yes gene_type:complete